MISSPTSNRRILAAVAASTLSMMLFTTSTTNLVVQAFSTVAPSSSSVASYSRLFLSDQPSDTSSDSYYDDDEVVIGVESEEFLPTASESLVTSILDLIPNFAAHDEQKRAEINEALLKLEALNPTSADPALSPLLNGVWELRYAGLYTSEGALGAFSPTRQLALFVYSGGYSPGLFALEVAQKLPFVEIGSLSISISRQQPRVEGTVAITSPFLGTSSVSVKSKLDVLSDVRLRETYESATVFGNEMEIPEFAKYSREIYVTYVDEDLLIIRDGSGVPELLVRKEKSFTRNWGTEPTSVDDVLPPGIEED